MLDNKFDPATKPSRHSRYQIAFLCLSLIAATTSPALAQRSALDEEGRLVDFNRDIAPIFRKHCLDCHNADDAKADFQIDDSEVVFSYVEPGDLESSYLYTDYLLSDDPDMMMPPPDKGGPLSPAELTLVRVWIEEGAHWPEDAVIAAPDEATSAEAQEEKTTPEMPRSLIARVWIFQGFFHPATVHFPIALFLFGALFVVLGWIWKPLGTQIPLACLLVGAPTALASTMMGFALATEEGYGSWTKVDFDGEVFWHRWSGVIVSVLSVVFALIAMSNWRQRNSRRERTWKFGLLVLAALVGLVGHQGGELKYGADFYPRAFRILLGQPEEITAIAPANEPIGEASSDAGEQSDGEQSDGEQSDGEQSDGEASTAEEEG